jgi:DNA-binding PadR family transcriptional regulator
MLEEGGFLTSADEGGKKVYTITAAGREILTEVGRERARERPEGPGAGPDAGPFAAFGWQPPRHLHELRHSIGELIGSTMHLAWNGDPEQVRKLREVLERAAREVRDIGKS